MQPHGLLWPTSILSSGFQFPSHQVGVYNRLTGMGCALDGGRCALCTSSPFVRTLDGHVIFPFLPRSGSGMYYADEVCDQARCGFSDGIVPLVVVAVLLCLLNSPSDLQFTVDPCNTKSNVDSLVQIVCALVLQLSHVTVCL